MTLQEQIKTCLKEASITPYQLSKDTGINESQLSRFLNNKVDISLKKLIQISEYLDCEIKLVRNNKDKE